MLPKWIAKLSLVRWLIGGLVVAVVAAWWALRRAQRAQRRFMVERDLAAEDAAWQSKLKVIRYQSEMAQRAAARRHANRQAELEAERVKIDRAASEGTAALAKLWAATFRPGSSHE